MEYNDLIFFDGKVFPRFRAPSGKLGGTCMLRLHKEVWYLCNYGEGIKDHFPDMLGFTHALHVAPYLNLMDFLHKFALDTDDARQLSVITRAVLMNNRQIILDFFGENNEFDGKPLTVSQIFTRYMNGNVHQCMAHLDGRYCDNEFMDIELNGVYPLKGFKVNKIDIDVPCSACPFFSKDNFADFFGITQEQTYLSLKALNAPGTVTVETFNEILGIDLPGKPEFDSHLSSSSMLFNVPKI